MSARTILRVSIAALACALVTFGAGGLPAHARAAPAADDCVVFPETDYTICGRFLVYWQANGGLEQQGLPLTEEFDEVNPTNKQTYETQYFERARFEYHEKNAPPYDVLLGLLGDEQLKAKYKTGLPAPMPGNPLGTQCATFTQTGKKVCGVFLDYWREHGGLAQQGLPLTDLFLETNPTNGKQYPTQYFERACFEYHEENEGTRYVVLLGLLGREQFATKPDPGQRADLAVSTISMNPTRPRAGQPYLVRSSVKNLGQVASGRYNFTNAMCNFRRSCASEETSLRCAVLRRHSRREVWDGS